jgi:iron complex transport system substrate-binding protein
MSPNLTQIVFAMNAGDKLVGVDQFSVYPPVAKSLPRMGSFLAPNLEALIAARPDLVLIVNSDEKMKELLDGAGLKYKSFGNDKVADILDSIKQLGVLLDCPRTSGMLLQKFQAVRDVLDSRLKDAPRTRVVLVAGRDPGRLQDISVAGASSFLGELIDMAGGDNVFADLKIAWPQVGVEAIIAADPDVIIDSTLSKGASDADFKALEHDWDALPSLRAVKNHRVIVPRDGWWQIPGAYMDSALLLLAHWLHPDLQPKDIADPNKTFQANPAATHE